MSMLDMIPIIVAMAFLFGFIAWDKYRRREELWDRYVRIGVTVFVDYRGKIEHFSNKIVGKKIVDYTKDSIRLQHIGWLTKNEFLRRVYFDRYGRLFMKYYES